MTLTNITHEILTSCRKKSVTSQAIAEKVAGTAHARKYG